MLPKVKVYALSTCIHCKNAREFLTRQDIPFECVEVDQLAPEEKKAVVQELKPLNPALSFPTIIVGEKVLRGFNRDELLAALDA